MKRMKLIKGFIYLILTFVYIWVSSVILVFHGPFGSLKSYVTRDNWFIAA